MLLFKGLKREMKRMLYPKRVELVTVDRRPVENGAILAVGIYLVCYVLVFVFSSILVSLNSVSFATNFTAVASCLNNIGPGLEGVGPTANFGFFSPLSKAVLIFDMLAGRLEFFPILLLFAPATWKK